MRHDGKIYTAQFSPDGKKVLTSAVDGTARVWEAGTGKLLATLPHGGIFRAAFSPDGSQIVTTNNNGPARVWDWPHSKLVLLVGGEPAVGWAQFSPDGKRILTSGSAARVWDATTGQPLVPPLGDSDFGGLAGNNEDAHRIACVWDASTGALLAKTDAHPNNINSINFSPDGTFGKANAARRDWAQLAKTIPISTKRPRKSTLAC
jgi:WD40 repeat protein